MNKNLLFQWKKVVYSIPIAISFILFLNGCTQLENTLPEPVLDVFNLGGENLNNTSGIQTALKTSGNTLSFERSNQNQNTALDTRENFTLVIEALNISNATIDEISQAVSLEVQKPQDINVILLNDGRELGTRVPSDVPTGISDNPWESWIKLDEYQSLYYKSVSNSGSSIVNDGSDDPDNGSSVVDRQSPQYIEYQAISVIVPADQEDQNTLEQQSVEEVVRIHMVLVNDLDDYPFCSPAQCSSRFDYETQSENLNEDHQGLYGYNVAYGIWHDPSRRSASLPSTGTARYTGLFLGRQRLEISDLAQNIDLVARESEVPVMSFVVNFATSNVDFTIENAELTVISSDYSGTANLNIQGSGEVGSNGLTGRIESVVVDMSTQATGSMSPLQNKFTIDEFARSDTEEGLNTLQGYFYNRESDTELNDSSIVAGYLYGEATHLRSIRLQRYPNIMRIDFYIDGIFLAEQ